MNIQILNAPADLFLGSDAATAFAQGPRHFRSAAKAVRFAMEHAAPVSLRGAMLKIGDRKLGPAQIRHLYRGLDSGRAAGGPVRNNGQGADGF
ncbi:hypothetical protein O9Z70_10015 [Devosia sp. YIM 151766]|uniref:hypothetical protein n=1 Tax=Devosia sp. YIM 151766 TaxID=3017325 RepID=UPI00255CF7A6|nr:hypothetical protein [Devosia sp. YIM 151766]WIY51820.1 hypothetical protein O9Z70_10015 [Devosia sp. YIM 151766]